MTAGDSDNSYMWTLWNDQGGQAEWISHWPETKRLAVGHRCTKHQEDEYGQGYLSGGTTIGKGADFIWEKYISFQGY